MENGHVTNGHNSNGNGRSVPALYRSKPNRLKQIQQGKQLQALAFQAAIALKETCTDKDTGTLVMDVPNAQAIQRLVGAWDTARNAVRILRGKGLPAAVKARQGRTDTQVKPLDPA